MWRILSIHHIIETTTQFNTFIFSLRRVPLLKRIIPNNLSSFKDMKWLYQALSLLIYFFKKMFQTLLFILGLIGISLYLKDKFNLSLPFETVCLTSLLFVYLIELSFIGSIFVDSDRTTLIAYKVFKLPIRTYLLVKNSYDDSIDSLIFILLLSIFRNSFGLTLLEIISLTLLSFSFRLLLAYCSLFTYQYNDITPYKKTILGIAMITLFSFICYCLILGFSIILPFHLILSPITSLIAFILSIVILYRLKNEQRIDKIAKNYLTFDKLMTSIDESIQTDTIKINDKDISYQINATRNVTNQEAIPYLNTIFFQRLEPHLKKKLHLKMVILLVFLIALPPFILLAQYQSILKDLTHYYLPISLSAAMLFYPSEFYTKFCFYHLDRNFLRYHFYRQRQKIISTIWIRLWFILKLEIPMFIIVTTFWLILFILSKQIDYIILLTLILNQTILFLIFSSLHLILYYLFQPFTEGTKVKSPIYNFCNHLLTFGSFSLFRVFIEYTTNTVMIVLFFSYCIIVIATIYYIAPKSFKLK